MKQLGTRWGNTVKDPETLLDHHETLKYLPFHVEFPEFGMAIAVLVQLRGCVARVTDP